MANPPTKEKIPHVRSPHHRTAVIDNASSIFIEQGYSDRILCSLTRYEIFTAWDNIERQHNGQFTIVPGEAGTVEQRVFEFTADMTPDQTINLVNNLLETLSKMPKGKKEKYGIPQDIHTILPIARI